MINSNNAETSWQAEVAHALGEAKRLGRGVCIFGLLLVLGAVVLYFLDIESVVVDIIMYVLGIPGVVFALISPSYKRDAKCFGECAPYIYEQNITSIREIALKTGYSAEEISRRLSGAKSHLKVLQDATIDKQNCLIYFGDVPPSQTVQVNIEQTKLADCVSCGAAGQTVQCEFCGSVIE